MRSSCVQIPFMELFSILNSTPFFSFRRYEDSSEFSTNDRLHTLLSWTGLSERMLYGNEDTKKCMGLEVDWEDVQKRVVNKRTASMDYLKKALKI